MNHFPSSMPFFTTFFLLFKVLQISIIHILQIYIFFLKHFPTFLIIIIHFRIIHPNILLCSYHSTTLIQIIVKVITENYVLMQNLKLP